MALRVVYYEASHDHASRRNSPEFHQLYPLARSGSRWEVNQARFPIIADQRKDTRRLPTQLPGLLACGDPECALLVAAGEQQEYGLGPSDGGPATSTGHSASLVVRFRRGGTAGTAGRTSPPPLITSDWPHNSGPMRPSIVGSDGDVHRLEGDAGAEPLSTCFAPATQPIAERLGTISPEPRRGNHTSISSNTHASPYVLFRAPHIPSLQNRTPRYLSALSACPFPMTMRSYTPASI